MARKPWSQSLSNDYRELVNGKGRVSVGSKERQAAGRLQHLAWYLACRCKPAERRAGPSVPHWLVTSGGRAGRQSVWSSCLFDLLRRCRPRRSHMGLPGRMFLPLPPCLHSGTVPAPHHSCHKCSASLHTSPAPIFRMCI